MKKFNLLTLLITVFFIASCNRTDFSNPEDVLKNYWKFTDENKSEVLYNDYLSGKSKEFVTKDEYVKTRDVPDSILKGIKKIESKISSFPLDVDNPSYRRFKVEETLVYKADTAHNLRYYTLINENGKWKIIWWQTLYSFANNKFDGGNYSEARKTLEKIIEIDPFSGMAYNLLACCYYRDKSLARNEWENGVVKNAKYALSLEEENSNMYQVLAGYYLTNSNNDLAIQTYERGLKYCKDKEDKFNFYDNLASTYIGMREYKKAEDYIIKSIAINENNCFAWFKYAEIMQWQMKFPLAIEYYKKALSKPHMENALQCELYYNYAVCCFKNGDCTTSKEYTNKALDMEPNNSNYQQLYNSVKDCR